MASCITYKVTNKSNIRKQTEKMIYKIHLTLALFWNKFDIEYI